MRMEVAVQAGEAPERHDHSDRPGDSAPTAGVGGEAQRGQSRKRPDRNDEAGAVEDDEENHQQGTAECGADEVCRVQPIHLLRESGQREADDHAAEYKRDGDHCACEDD